MTTTELPIEPDPFVTGDRVRIDWPSQRNLHGREGILDSFRGAVHVPGAPCRDRLARVLLDGDVQHNIVRTKNLEKVLA